MDHTIEGTNRKAFLTVKRKEYMDYRTDIELTTEDRFWIKSVSNEALMKSDTDILTNIALELLDRAELEISESCDDETIEDLTQLRAFVEAERERLKPNRAVVKRTPGELHA